MARPIMGTKDLKGRQLPNGTIIKKAQVGGVGSMRCPKCQGVCTPRVDQRTGKQVLQCGKCLTSFTKQAM